MSPLLHHVDLVTRCRRRSEVEGGVVTALNDLLGATRTQLFKIFMPPGDVLIGLSSEISTGEVRPRAYDDGFSWPDQTGSIEQWPHLQLCLGNGAPCLGRQPDGLERLTLLVRSDQNEPYAFLQALRATPFSPEEIDLVTGFAALLRNSLSMLDYSETDSLTRLLNRKTFDEHLINILSTLPPRADPNSALSQAPLRRQVHPEAKDHWLGVMDIDHFKSINDRFGHLIGDEVLILTANLMRESFRAQDRLFRFGGEEFVALLRPGAFSHAFRTFDRFRQRMESHVFPQVGKVTISIGFSRIALGDTPSAILDMADDALYWAKENGRNQCHAYETLLAEGKLKAHAALDSDCEFFR